MTLEPAKLERLGDSLGAEAKSVEILRRRLDGLAPAGDEGEKGVERAREVLAAYEAWLADTSGEFKPGTNAATEEREVQDIIDEVLSRQRYISNQLTLLTLKSKRKPKGETHIAKLQSYNEVKDAAQELMGLVAESRGVAVGRLYEGGEFGVSAAD